MNITSDKYFVYLIYTLHNETIKTLRCIYLELDWSNWNYFGRHTKKISLSMNQLKNMKKLYSLVFAKTSNNTKINTPTQFSAII